MTSHSQNAKQSFTNPQEVKVHNVGCLVVTSHTVLQVQLVNLCLVWKVRLMPTAQQFCGLIN